MIRVLVFTAVLGAALVVTNLVTTVPTPGRFTAVVVLAVTWAGAAWALAGLVRRGGQR